MDATMQAVSTFSAGYNLAVAAGVNTMNIRDYNNVVHTGIATSDIQTMLIELGNNCQTQLDKKWMLESKVNEATTQTDLDKITW